MLKLKIGCRLVSLLIILSFCMTGLKMAHASLQTISDQWWGTTWGTYLIILTVLFIILNLAAAYGLFFLKKWSFLITYIAIIVSTLFFSFSYIPYLDAALNNLFSIKVYGMSLFIVNLIVFIVVIYLHRLYRRINK
ncbi:MAG: hypothetical protein ABI597_11765 [Gammaproteobacteria bacterium]